MRKQKTRASAERSLKKFKMAEVLLGGKKLGELKVTELKSELEKRGLPKKGVKSVLLTRLKNAILREALALDEAADVEEDEDGVEADTSQAESTISEVESVAEVQQNRSHEDSEPMATTPTHELDPGHMSGAEETTPTVNPPPAVVPSPDDSAKEITGQDQEVEEKAEEVEHCVEEEKEVEEELKMEEPIEDDDMLLDDDDDEPTEPMDAPVESELKDTVEESLPEDSVPEDKAEHLPDGEQSTEPVVERLDSIDPSYNPNGEELLYEGDMETETSAVKTDNKDVGAQDEGFIVSVHDTGTELDMTESLAPHSKSTSITTTSSSSTVTTSSSGNTVKTSDSTPAKSSQYSRHSSDSGGGKSSKTTPSAKSGAVTLDNKKSDKSTASPAKSEDRCSLWVSGLIPTVRALDLQTLFSPYAQVISAKVVAKSRTKQLRFGFITVSTPEEAQTCINELNGTELKGKKITVELAKTQPPISKVATSTTNSSKSSSNSQPSSSAREKSGSSSNSDKKTSTSSSKSASKPSTSSSGKSSSKSIADRIVERSRRSVEIRKVTTTDRSKDNRRKSAPMSHRSRSRSRERERVARLSAGHRSVSSLHTRSPPHSAGGPAGRGGHVSVHSRLGAPANQEAMQREMAERDMYMRDRERQAEVRLHRQLEAERTRREQDLAHRLQEIRDRENREREIRERQLMEQERLFKEKERELREREYRERQRREALERQLRERESQELQFREREKRLKEIHEKEMRDREIRALKEREMREREARMQAERDRELRERERRIKEEQERIERERRVHEEQQRWIREETARVARVKEEAARLQKEREESERRDRERRQREEKERREEERIKRERERQEREREREREREQKRERDDIEKRVQSGGSRLGKRPYQQDNGTFESKRPAYSTNASYGMSNSSSIFSRLDPHKANRSGQSQADVAVPTAPLIQPKDLSHVNPEIINAASQALANIRKSVPTGSSHLSSGRGGGSLQAQIQQLAAATALASSSNRSPGMGMDFRGNSSNSSGSQHYADLMRPSMTGRAQGSGGMGMLSKSPHIGNSMSGGGGSGGLGKLPPEDQRYNRRLGGSRSGGGSSGAGGYRGHGGRQGGGY